jgi:hypothetical protein
MLCFVTNAKVCRNKNVATLRVDLFSGSIRGSRLMFQLVLKYLQSCFVGVAFIQTGSLPFHNLGIS